MFILKDRYRNCGIFNVVAVDWIYAADEWKHPWVDTLSIWMIPGTVED